MTGASWSDCTCPSSPPITDDDLDRNCPIHGDRPEPHAGGPCCCPTPSIAPDLFGVPICEVCGGRPA